MRATAIAALLALSAMTVMAQLTDPNNVVWSSDGCVETLPGIPQSLTATAKSQTEILISWQPPAGDACIDAFSYSIVERGAPDANLAAAPRVQALTVLVQNLRPNTEYVIKVAAYTRAKGVGAPATTNARTLTSCIAAVPGPVGNIYLTSTDVATTWRLSWLAPTSGGCVGDYYADVVNPTTNRAVFASGVGTAEIAIPNLVPGTTYNFRVFARNNFGSGPARRATYTIPASVYMRPLGKGTKLEYNDKNTDLEPAPTTEAGTA